MISRIFIGTKVTPARYGVNSWAVVTGCTEGIGKALALELAQRGFNIVLISRNSEKLSLVVKEIQEKYKRDTRMIVFDFGKDCSIQGYESIAKKLEGLDVSILVNNVGVSNMPEFFQNIKPEDVHQEVIINTYPIVLLTKVLVN